MSRGYTGKWEDLARELRQFQELSTSFLRAAAGRTGLAMTDMQVIDTLQSTGSATAGELAETTGLTTGAITGILIRLEEAGVVRRERDPDDGRKVIVRLVPDQGAGREHAYPRDAMSKMWQEMTTDYDDAQLAVLLGFFQRSNALFRQEITQLREAPEGTGDGYAVPLGDVTSGQLVVVGSARLTMRADQDTTRLYSARFEGAAPDIKAKEETVTIRYPRRLWRLGAGQRAAEVMLNAAIPWQIMIQGGAAEVVAELSGINLAGLEIQGGLWRSRLDLPVPSGVVPIRLSGGAAEITIRRPAGVAARVHLKGWASEFVFDEQVFSALGNDVRLQSTGFDPAAPCYDIDISGSASKATITTD